MCLEALGFKGFTDEELNEAIRLPVTDKKLVFAKIGVHVLAKAESVNVDAQTDAKAASGV